MNEKFLSPKELADALTHRLSRRISAKYVRGIRIVCAARGEVLFVAGGAKLSDVISWLERNPSYRSNAVYRKKIIRTDAFPVSNGNI